MFKGSSVPTYGLFSCAFQCWWAGGVLLYFDREGNVTEEARVPQPCCFITSCRKDWGGNRVFSSALVQLGQNHGFIMSLYNPVLLHVTALLEYQPKVEAKRQEERHSTV